MTQGDSSLGCHGCKLISITPHTKKMKDKNHTTISADTEKAFDKIPLFTYKPSIDWLQKQRNVNIIKATYNKSTRNIILSGEKWKATIRNETGMLVLAFLFYCVFFFWLHHKACGILVPPPGIELGLPLPTPHRECAKS